MITKSEFLTEFNGHSNAYASYVVSHPNVTVDDVIDVLNEINPNMCVGSGVVNGMSISFEICKVTPDLIYNITEKLCNKGFTECRGFADMGSWYGDAYFIAVKDGDNTDEFYAEWTYDDQAAINGDDEYFDAFITVTDLNGVTFHTGEGAIDEERLKYWQGVVNKHQPKKKSLPASSSQKKDTGGLTMERFTENNNGCYCLALPSKLNDMDLKFAVYDRLGKAEDIMEKVVQSKELYERTLEKLDATGKGSRPEANAIRLLLELCDI